MDCSPIAIAPEMFSAIFDCPIARVAHWDLTRNQFKKGGFVKLIYIYWLVVESPLFKKNSSSVGIITIPNIWKNKIHVPNNQPVYRYIMGI